MTIQGGRTRKEREIRNVSTKFSQGLCRVSQDTAQTVGTAGENIEFDTVDYDPNGWYSVSTFRYTPKSPGTYLVIVSVSFALAPTAGSNLYIYKNGAVYALLSRTRNDTQRHFYGSCMVDFNGTTDYITTFMVPVAEKDTDGVVTSNYMHIVQIGYNKP